MTLIASPRLKGLPEENLREMLSPQLMILLVAVPSLPRLNSMRHDELLKVLKHCPYSEYFGMKDASLNFSFKEARAKVKIIFMNRSSLVTVEELSPILEGTAENSCCLSSRQNSSPKDSLRTSTRDSRGLSTRASSENADDS